MTKCQSSILALLSALMLSASPVYAAEQSMVPSTDHGVTAGRTHQTQMKASEAIKPAPAKASQNTNEVAASNNQPAESTVNVSMFGAISIATRHGKVFDVSFKRNPRGEPAYHVKAYRNRSVWEGTVDAKSGQFIGRGKMVRVRHMDREDRAEIAALRRSKITLAQAIRTAEHHGSGRAIEAGLEETRGKVAYEITVLKGGSPNKVTIDPSNGRVLAG